jgi:hypothetical protein
MGPVAGAYVPTPAASNTVLDLSSFKNKYVRIQAIAENLFYVFAASSTATMVGLTSADFKFDMTAVVPVLLGEGFQDEVVVPSDFPFLLLRSATGTPGEARIFRV